MFGTYVNTTEPAGKYNLGRLSYGVLPVLQALLAIIVLLLVSSCGNTPMTLSGTISLGGVPQEVASCSMSGKSADLALNLLLQGGATVTLPIHESKVLLKLNDKSSPMKLSCETHSKDGTGGSGYYEGDISLSCGADQTALSMDLHINCGKGPSSSNRDPDEKGPPS